MSFIINLNTVKQTGVLDSVSNILLHQTYTPTELLSVLCCQFQYWLKTMVHSSLVSSAHLECRQQTDPISFQQAGRDRSAAKEEKKIHPFHLYKLLCLKQQARAIYHCSHQLQVMGTVSQHTELRG